MNKYIINIKKILPTEQQSIKAIKPVMDDVRARMDKERTIRELPPLTDEQFYNIIISLSEALTNAIIHGNKSNPDKKVSLRIYSTYKTFVIIVKDEGDGFNPYSLSDPRRPENLMKESGRGIFLIRELSNKVEFKFTKTGTEIKIYFKIK
jgi:serine/threonine-protein kinase RsbW